MSEHAAIPRFRSGRIAPACVTLRDEGAQRRTPRPYLHGVARIAALHRCVSALEIGQRFLLTAGDLENIADVDQRSPRIRIELEGPVVREQRVLETPLRAGDEADGLACRRRVRSDGHGPLRRQPRPHRWPRGWLGIEVSTCGRVAEAGEPRRWLAWEVGLADSA